MKKKTLGRIAALSIAAVTAVPTFSMVASADIIEGNTIKIESTVWKVEVYNPTTGALLGTRYYKDKASADRVANSSGTDDSGNNYFITQASSTSTSNAFDNKTGVKFDIDVNGQIIVTSTGRYTYNGTTSGSSNTNYYGYNYATDKVFYSASTNRYYPNRQAYYADSRNSGTTPTISDVKGVKYDSSHRYFNYMGGYYTNVESGNTEYMSHYVGDGYYNQYVIPSGYTYASNTSYYSPETGTWYPNLEALRAAVGYNTTNYSTKTPASYNQAYSSANHYFNPEDGLYYSTSGGNRVSVTSGSATTYYRYYSIVTGKYYNTYNEALTASGGVASYVRTISSNSNYYNGIYGYDDPYYYYYYLLGNNGIATTTKDNSTVTIGRLKGWTSVTRTINSAKAGTAYTVSMQTETEIPESVLKALKGKNVSINFKFSNGAVFTLNGNDITSTTAISPVIRYGSTSIPTSLKNKAVKANSGVSSSQFTINGGSFGAEASVTVKFNSKRSGCSAKLYRYNASANTLSLVSRSAVQNNGQCNFDGVKQGGEYIVVLS